MCLNALSSIDRFIELSFVKLFRRKTWQTQGAVANTRWKSRVNNNKHELVYQRLNNEYIKEIAK